MAAGPAAPWQFELGNLELRYGFLLTSGQWSDCTFVVGTEPNQTEVPSHKLILALSSPVFEAMFYGGLSESQLKDPKISIPDVQPDAFRAMLQYIYTGNVKINSFNLAWELWHGATKYMLPNLVQKCNAYISSVVGPRTACMTYELASFFGDKTLMAKCFEIISTNTKEALDSSFEDCQLSTVITVCSFEHLNVDSELDLFQAVARYAEAERWTPGQSISPLDGGPSVELNKALEPRAFKEKVSLMKQSGPALDLYTEKPNRVVTSRPTADNENLNEEEPTIKAALQKIRFLTMTPAEFAEGPARSGLLTEGETLAILMNISSGASGVPMPTGFSECRERRQPRSDSTDQSLKTGRWEHIIKALKCGIPSRVEEAVRAAYKILRDDDDDYDDAPNIQQALDKGILDALIPALTEGNETCKNHAACAICIICRSGSPSQLRVLPEAAVLQPFCRLLTAGGSTCCTVLLGLVHMLDQKRVELNTRHALLLKLRDIGVPQLLATVERDGNGINRRYANELLRDQFAE